MENLKIKSMLVAQGITFTDIARSLDRPVSCQMVSSVARGKSKTPYIRLAIAECLGVEVLDLFPDYKPANRKTGYTASKKVVGNGTSEGSDACQKAADPI